MGALVDQGELMDVGGGLYCTPVRWEDGTVNFWETFEAYEEQADEIITCTAGTAANRLGLMDQCPMKEARFTSGATREMRIGKMVTCSMMNVPDWQLLLGDTIPGMAIRCFAWGEADMVAENAKKLSAVLSDKDWNEIRKVSKQLPAWLNTAIWQ